VQAIHDTAKNTFRTIAIIEIITAALAAESSGFSFFTCVPIISPAIENGKTNNPIIEKTSASVYLSFILFILL